MLTLTILGQWLDQAYLVTETNHKPVNYRPQNSPFDFNVLNRENSHLLRRMCLGLHIEMDNVAELWNECQFLWLINP